MSIYNTLRDGLEYLTDLQTLTQVRPCNTLTSVKEGYFGKFLTELGRLSAILLQ